MTDSGVPPSTPGDRGSSSSGPRPRVGAGDVNGANRSAARGAAEPNRPPSAVDFWRDEDEAEASAPFDVQTGIRTVMEWVAVAIGALVVALVIKAFLLQAFYIPSASMEPTLHEDDRVLVNKLSYRVGDVQRGDVIVFEKPEGAGGEIDDFIKRVVGLPGETVSFSDGSVFIDGERLTESYVEGAQSNPGPVIEGCDNAPALADTCQVPDGMVFVMGDNRLASQDSRYFGPIDQDSIVGRAFMKVWPLGDIGFL
ncbi:MAG: signal peptidase I [Acidimicrobiales bacterium]